MHWLKGDCPYSNDGHNASKRLASEKGTERPHPLSPLATLHAEDGGTEVFTLDHHVNARREGAKCTTTDYIGISLKDLRYRLPKGVVSPCSTCRKICKSSHGGTLPCGGQLSTALLAPSPARQVT